MSKERTTLASLAKAEAQAKVMDKFVPQMFSPPDILTGGAPDSGGTDIWMMTNMPAEVLLPLAGLQTIGEADDRKEIKTFVQVVLRGLKGIGGFNMKVGENIATALGGGVGRKIVKRPGWASRNITNRDWREKAESEGAEIEE